MVNKIHLSERPRQKLVYVESNDGFRNTMELQGAIKTIAGVSS